MFILFLFSGYLSTYAPEPEFVGDIPSIKVIAGKDAILRCLVENLGDLKASVCLLYLYSMTNLNEKKILLLAL